MDSFLQDFRIGRHISILYRHGQCFMNMKMTKYGLGSGQYTFLLYLYGNDGISQDELSKALDIDKATTARAIARLEQEKYVKRDSDPSDKRINRVFLTDKSLELKSEIMEITNEWKKIILKDIDKNSQEQLKLLMEQMTENASEYKKAMCIRGEKNEK